MKTIEEMTQEILDLVGKSDASDTNEIVSVSKSITRDYTERELGILIFVLASKVIENNKKKGWFSQLIEGTDFEKSLNNS